jgi:peptidyl-prolyl cis-trans isomerase C
MRTRSISLIISACLAIVLASVGLSCKPKTPKETKATKTEPNAPSEPNASKVAVTVNGVPITEGDVTALIEPQVAAIDKQSSKLPPAIAEQYKKQLRQQALEQLIRRDLLDQKIKQANITVTDEEVIAKIREIVSEPGKLLSLEEAKKKVEQYGQNFDRFKEAVRESLVRNKFMEQQWAGQVNVTDEEAKKYYDENRKLFDVPEQIRASHILITYKTNDPNVDPNEAKAKARAEAESLLKQLKNGADFATLAKKYSSCPSAPRGGDLGFFPRGKTTPAFEKAAFALKVGQLSDVVETEYGFHIIKVTDHKDASVIPFEQAKANIIAQLKQKKEAEFAEKYINSLKANANIVFPS